MDNVSGDGDGQTSDEEEEPENDTQTTPLVNGRENGSLPPYRSKQLLGSPAVAAVDISCRETSNTARRHPAS